MAVVITAVAILSEAIMSDATASGSGVGDVALEAGVEAVCADPSVSVVVRTEGEDSTSTTCTPSAAAVAVCVSVKFDDVLVAVEDVMVWEALAFVLLSKSATNAEGMAFTLSTVVAPGDGSAVLELDIVVETAWTPIVCVIVVVSVVVEVIVTVWKDMALLSSTAFSFA